MSENNNSTKNLIEKIKSLKLWTKLICFVILHNFFYNSLTKTLEFFISTELATVVAGLIGGIIVGFYSDNVLRFIDLFINKSESLVQIPTNIKLLTVCNFLYSTKTQKEVFEPLVADWQEEYFEALFKKEIWKARWINVRYTYAFLGAMWQKSPLGDLLEFISKIAK